MRKRSEVVAARKAKDTDEDRKAQVDETSAALRDELEKNAAEPPGGIAPAPKKYAFPTAQKAGSDPDLRADLRQIVETHWVEDMNASWQRIRAALKVGVNRSKHGHLHKALDVARDLSQEAHGLWMTAKLEGRRWENANEVTHGKMWNEATRALQHEKDQGLRSKQITDADVRAKVATLYPDEFAAQEFDREKIKLTVDRMGALAKDASEKCEDLRVMLAKLRG